MGTTLFVLSRFQAIEKVKTDRESAPKSVKILEIGSLDEVSNSVDRDLIYSGTR